MVAVHLILAEKFFLASSGYLDTIVYWLIDLFLGAPDRTTFMLIIFIKTKEMLFTFGNPPDIQPMVMNGIEI